MVPTTAVPGRETACREPTNRLAEETRRREECRAFGPRPVTHAVNIRQARRLAAKNFAGSAPTLPASAPRSGMRHRNRRGSDDCSGSLSAALRIGPRIALKRRERQSAERFRQSPIRVAQRRTLEGSGRSLVPPVPPVPSLVPPSVLHRSTPRSPRAAGRLPLER